MASHQQYEQQQQFHTPASSNPRSTQSQASPSALIEPLMNSLFVSPTTSGAAAAAAAAAASSPPPRPPQQQQQPSMGTTTPTPSSASSMIPPGVALDKKSLQLALLSLIQDERFIDLLHAQYLKVAHARARKDGKK